MDSTRNDATNVLSIDVEGFVESNVQSFPIDRCYLNRYAENKEIRNNTECVMSLLDASGVKATFFFVGRIAFDLPKVVQEVANAGHEIGCHSHQHLRVFGENPRVFREGVDSAKKRLEDVAGQAVYGFRAPDFSIVESSLWALDILRDLGFVYDSSIYPIGLHDVYGIDACDEGIHRLPNGLMEFPLSTFRVGGKRLPFGGGGYLRLYPVSLTRLLIRRYNENGRPAMLFVHPYEIGPIIPKIAGLSYFRRFRHYYNCTNGFRRLQEILKGFKFGRAIDVLRPIIANFPAMPMETPEVNSVWQCGVDGIWPQYAERRGKRAIG